MKTDERIKRIKADMKMGPFFIVGWLESFFLNPLEKDPVMTRKEYDRMIDEWEKWNDLMVTQSKQKGVEHGKLESECKG